jgi:hypothetical protein
MSFREEKLDNGEDRVVGGCIFEALSQLNSYSDDSNNLKRERGDGAADHDQNKQAECDNPKEAIDSSANNQVFSLTAVGPTELMLA